ncbi:MAG: ArnT family glycosyltransferase [Solirubrobacteraceae bacterium]
MTASAATPSVRAPAVGRRSARRLADRLRATDVEARWLCGAVVVFVLVSLWWLTQDDRVPDFDSGLHMTSAMADHFYLATGHLSEPWTNYNSYPPLVALVGAASIFLFGVHPMALIMTSNVVFVPLLALGCYGTGRIVAGPRAGLLAGLLALGTPMFVSMMHEYDLDPPQAAMVAVTVWAILASRRFERIWISALAGWLFGLALLTKETSVVFVAGLLAVVLVRGGWRQWRGLLAFAFVLETTAGPWYTYHATQILGSFTSLGQLAPSPVQAPPRLSTANLGWYFWNLLNEQTLSIFGALFFIGVALAIWRCLRHRVRADNVYPELLLGALVSYLAMTYLTHKDPRYTLPGLVYVAVLGASWIVALRRPMIRRALSTGVAVLSAIYLAGMSFGIGGTVQIALPGAQTTIIYPWHLTLYETAGWVRGGPVTDGHVLALFRGLRAMGIREVDLYTGNNEIDFNSNGIGALAAASGIYVAPVPLPPGPWSAYVFVHTPRPGDPPACQTLNDGEGIYVAADNFQGLDPGTLTDPHASAPLTFICPGRGPLAFRPQP